MDIPYQTLFQVIIEQSGEGISLTDSNGNYILVNPAFCQMTGYSESELLTMQVRDLIPATTELVIYPKINGGQASQRELELIKKDGSLFLAEIRDYPIYLAQQKMVLAFVQDITAQKRSTAQIQLYLRQTELLHQTIEQLNRAQSWDEIYAVAGKGILHVLLADRSSILLFDEDERAHFKAWQNLSPRYRQAVDGHCPWQIHETDAQPIFYSDVSASDMDPDLQQIILDEGIRALLFVPLSRTDRLLGKFMVYYNKPHHWSDEELQLAQVIAQNLSAVITRQQTMAELQRLAEFNRSIVASAPVGIATINHAGQATSANDALIKITGSPSLEETLKLNIHIPAIQKVNFEAIFAEILTSGETLTVSKLPYVTHWGKDLIINLKVVPQKALDGSITGAVLVMDDVTADARAEALQVAVYQIAQAADHAAALDDFFPAIHRIVQTVMPADNFYLALYDETTDLIHFPYHVDENEPTTHSFRKPLKGWTEYVLRCGVSQLVTAERHQAMVEQGEVELIGSMSAVWLGVPLLVADKPIGVMAVQHYRDAHAFGEREQHMLEYVASQVARAIDRKQKEDALRQSEERMRSLARLAQKLELAHTHEEIARPLRQEIETVLGYRAVWIIMVDEDMLHARLLTGDGKIFGVLANQPQVFSIKGDAYLEEILEADHLIVIEDARTDPRTNKESVVQAGIRTIVNMPILLKHRRLGAICTGTFGDEGVKIPTPDQQEYLEAIARHVAVVIDRIQFMQERENSSLALQSSNQQLQEALIKLRETQDRMVQRERLAAVGQMAAGIAHDFNNIMAVIVLYTQMGLRTPDVSPKLQERLQTILHQAWRAADLVQQILDFSRRSVMEPRPLDLISFLQEQVNLLTRTLPENIQLHLVYEPDEYTVNADPTRLQQAIMNLVINARDAMPRGGELKLSLSRVMLTGDITCSVCQQAIVGEWVQLQIQDNGSGIAPATLLRIFEPFFTTKQAGQGSGLGLSQVAGIVDQHGGHVVVASQVGKGTVFILYLPALPVRPREDSLLPAAALPHGSGETILVVEDDAVTRGALVDSLEMLNYRVIAAANGQIALLILEQQRPNIALVLSDLVMPEMGGQRLLHAIRQRGLTLPVVLLTGHPLTNDLPELQTQGLTGWLLKPPDLEKLAQLLSRALDGEKKGSS